jgi:uncharacterized membrane protein YciS (DUF1049 family)
MSWLDRTNKWLLLLMVALGVGAVAIVSAQNPVLVSFKFVIWQSLPISLGLILSMILAAGVLIGGIIPLGKNR